MSAHEDHPVALTIFWPDRWRASPPVGVSLTETWAGLVRWASWPVVLDAKDAAGGYVLARLRDGVRKVDHVISVSCLSLDVDHGDVPASALHEALSRFAHLVYSTHSSTPAAPRSRVILPFTRPATPAEYAALWPHVARLMEAAGVPLDKSTRDPARLWFVPAVKPGAVFEVYEGTGELLDVDRLLAAARASAPVRPPRASAPAGYVRGGAPASGDRPFDTANALDPRAVAQWLGLYDGKRVRCPGCGEKQGVDVIDHGLKCFHNRCSDKGLSGFRTIVDLTSEVLSVDKFEAVNALAQRFGFSRRPS